MERYHKVLELFVYGDVPGVWGVINRAEGVAEVVGGGLDVTDSAVDLALVVGTEEVHEGFHKQGFAGTEWAFYGVDVALFQLHWVHFQLEIRISVNQTKFNLNFDFSLRFIVDDDIASDLLDDLYLICNSISRVTTVPHPSETPWKHIQRHNEHLEEGYYCHNVEILVDCVHFEVKQVNCK